MIRNQRADLKQVTSVAKTLRKSTTSSFPRLSTSYRGFCSAVPPDLTADVYYQDITPADHNVIGSYIHPSTPMPRHTDYHFIQFPRRTSTWLHVSSIKFSDQPFRISG